MNFERADIKQFCQVLVHLLDSNILGITEFSHQSVNILMSLSVLRFALTFFISVVSVCCLLPHLSCLLACHYDVIDAGHNNRLFALIWIGHFFVYHTFKKIRFTYKYVINIDYYMAFFISYPLSAIGHDISPRANKPKGLYIIYLYMSMTSIRSMVFPSVTQFSLPIKPVVAT